MSPRRSLFGYTGVDKEKLLFEIEEREKGTTGKTNIMPAPIETDMVAIFERTCTLILEDVMNARSSVAAAVEKQNEQDCSKQEEEVAGWKEKSEKNEENDKNRAEVVKQKSDGRKVAVQKPASLPSIKRKSDQDKKEKLQNDRRLMETINKIKHKNIKNHKPIMCSPKEILRGRKPKLPSLTIPVRSTEKPKENLGSSSGDIDKNRASAGAAGIATVNKNVNGTTDENGSIEKKHRIEHLSVRGTDAVSPLSRLLSRGAQKPPDVYRAPIVPGRKRPAPESLQEPPQQRDYLHKSRLRRKREII